VLSNDEKIFARLVVLANGLNVGLRRWLGIERRIASACHSVSIGFNLVPVGRPLFDFPALTYFSERTRERIPYLTLFLTGNTMRAVCVSPESTIPGCSKCGARRKQR